MAERSRLMWVAVYAVLATGAVWTVAPDGVAGLLIAPLALFCPGYALVRAVQGLRREDALEMAVLVVALSFATSALGGLVLQAASIGLTARAWSVLMLVVTAPACLVGARQPGPALAGGGAPRAHWRPAPWTAAAVITTVVVVVAAGIIGRSSADHLDAKRSTTALAVVPEPAKVSTVRLFVANTDRAATSYRVEIAVGARTIASFPLALRAGQTWSGSRRVRRREGEVVTVRLFRSHRPQTPYRTVTLS